MSLTVTTNASVDLSTSDGTTETVESYTNEFSASISIAPDSSDVAMELGGEATAIGDDTLALGSLEATLDATGSVTSAYGSATFVAAAESEGDETAFATADSFGSLSGMDVLVVITSNTQTVQEGPDGSLWVATSETTFYGVDYDSLATDGASPSSEGDEAPVADDFMISDPSAADLSDSDADLLDTDWVDIEGNIALLDVDADVLGEDTLLEVAADVLTIEDTLSIVVADLFAVVG
jgi:hypothetical protein